MSMRLQPASIGSACFWARDLLWSYFRLEKHQVSFAFDLSIKGFVYKQEAIVLPQFVRLMMFFLRREGGGVCWLSKQHGQG